MDDACINLMQLHASSLHVQQNAIERLCAGASIEGLQKTFQRRGGCRTLMRAMQTHGADAKLAQGALTLVGIVTFGAAENAAECNVCTMVSVMRMHAGNPQVCGSGLASIVDMTTDNLSQSLLDRAVAAGLPEFAIECMRRHAEFEGIQQDGCTVLTRMVEPSIRKLPARYADACRCARETLDANVEHAGIAGFACELLSVTTRSIVLEPDVKEYIAAVARAIVIHDDATVTHNAFCVLCNLIVCGGAKLAQLVVDAGAIALASRACASCETAALLCVGILELGLGHREAHACALADAFAGLDGHEYVRDVVRAHADSVEEMIRSLVRDDEAQRARKLKKKKPRQIHCVISKPRNYTVSDVMNFCDDACACLLEDCSSCVVLHNIVVTMEEICTILEL